MNERSIDRAQVIPKPRLEWADYDVFVTDGGLAGWVAYLKRVAGQAAEVEPSGYRTERSDEFERERMTVRSGRLSASLEVRVSLGMSRPESAMDRLVDAATIALGGTPEYGYREHWHCFRWPVSPEG